MTSAATTREAAKQAASGLSANVLDRLEAHFLKHGTKDGVEFIKAADVVHRLNEVLGPWGWTHIELRAGYDEPTDFLWSYGRLEGIIDGQPFAREQYGGLKVNRRKSDGAAIDWANDLKAAKTDSLKKCAKELGVAAYMDDPEERTEARKEQAEARSVAVTANGTVERETGELLACADCGVPLETVRFTGNKTWSPAELARRSKEKFNVICCMPHYKVRNDAAARDAVSANPRLKTAQGLRYPAEGG